MTFVKYNIANDAIGNLAVGIGASDTGISLTSGQGAQFPSSNAIVTIVQYATTNDPTSNVVKKESVVLTNRSSDSMTITRAFESSATDFNAGDWVYLTNHTAVTKDIQDEVTRLESDKLDKGGLRTALTTAWRFFFSNGSSNETELAFGDSGKYLKSTGASSTPVWDNPPLDINGQTTSTSPTTSWLVPLFNGTNNFKTTLANLVKGLATATTSQAGVVEMATDVEASAGIDELRCVNAKQLLANMPRTPGTATTHLSGSYSTSSTSYVDVESFTATTGGVYKVSYGISGSSGATTRVYTDGIGQGEFGTSSGTPVNNAHHITVAKGGVVYVQLKTGGVNSANLTSYSITSN